jgi:hypothetical protein
MGLRNLVLGIGLLALTGCASFDKAAQSTEDVLNRPLVAGTAQPTVGQTAQSAASLLGPWASLAGGAAMILLHEYNSSRRSKKLLSAVAASDVSNEAGGE